MLKQQQQLQQQQGYKIKLKHWKSIRNRKKKPSRLTKKKKTNNKGRKSKNNYKNVP